MRRISIFLLVLVLSSAPPVLAGSGESKDQPATSESKTANAPAPKSAVKKAAAAMPNNAAFASELTRMQQMIHEQAQELAEQRKQIDALQHQIETSRATAAPATASIAAPARNSSLAAAENVTPEVPESASNATPVAAESSAHATTTSSTLPAPDSAPAAQTNNAELGPIAYQDFKIGVTFFTGWSYYNSTGYGMQFLDTPTNQLPPGNDGYNTFEVNRSYVNFLYTPDQHVTLRITPDIYRQADQSYGFRLKYGYVDFQKIFGDGAFKNEKLTFGQTQQPLTDWEEGLSGYRYTYLTPWNYVSLSSTWVGAKLHGPILLNGKEYLDYDFGIFNTASFHAVETNENKQFMVRGTVYPLGTTADRTGLGFTVFNDFGYKTALPSQPQTSLDRLAVIGFYQIHSKAAQIAFEYDWGHNAFSTHNLFNGSGIPTGSYASFATLANNILSGSTHQQGYALFGHVRLGNSPFKLWGLWQYFQPNTDYDYKAAGLTANPIDWSRIVTGISYSVTSHFDLAFGDENFRWVHPQVSVTGVPTGPDTNGIVIWSQFNY